MITRSMIILCSFVLLTRCNQFSEKTDKSPIYKLWYNNETTGLQKKRKTKLLTIAASLIPKDILIQRQRSVATEAIDENDVKRLYDNTLYFELIISAQKSNVNLLWHNINSYEIYNSRLQKLNFGMEDFISMKYQCKAYAPVFTHFEGYNELSRKLVLHVAFDVSDWKSLNEQSELILSFQDPFWGSGINHFQFEYGDIIQRQIMDLG